MNEKSYGPHNKPSDNPRVGPTLFIHAGKGWVRSNYERLTEGMLFFLMDSNRHFIPNAAGGHFRIATSSSMWSEGQWWVGQRPAAAHEVPEGRTTLV